MSASSIKVESTGCAIRGVDGGAVLARTSTADVARRFAAAWNSALGVTTEQLDEIPGLVGHTVPYHVLRQQNAELRTALTFAIRFFDQLTPADAERMRNVLEKAGGAS